MVIFGQGREFGCGTGTNVPRSSPAGPGKREWVGEGSLARSLDYSASAAAAAASLTR